jgi:hypothetical protein
MKNSYSGYSEQPNQYKFNPYFNQNNTSHQNYSNNSYNNQTNSNRMNYMNYNQPKGYGQQYNTK